MWMGVWQPFVFSFSSNWKEFKTLHLTMIHLESAHSVVIRGVTVFYFTDNSTVYNICSSRSSPSVELQKLIEQITLLELKLGCRLVVVHAPGLVMILQGTDALSRGVWMSPLHDHMDPAAINAAVFAPQPEDPCLVDDLVGHFSLPSLWRYQPWDSQWDAELLFDRFTVWFPPPEIARQAIIFTLQAWCERPLTTSAMFVVPRILPAFWRGLSKHIQEITVLYPTTFQFRVPPLLPIPVVVLYLPPHTRSLPLPSSGVEPVAPSSGSAWHDRQAEAVRRLPPVPIAK